MSSVRCVVFSLMLVFISGCAINNKTFLTQNKSFDDGQQLITNGEFESGLQKLQQAVYEDPDNKEIRAVFARQRESVAGKLVVDAENSRQSGDLINAEQLYHRVLELFPHNERAQAGLEILNLERHHRASIEYAEELLKYNDLAGAEAIVRAVLHENPMQQNARQLIKQLSTQIARAENTGLTLETAFKKPLSMEFKDTDLKSVFEIMTRAAGINFVFDKDIRQDAKVSVFVRDNTIEDILKLLLMTNQLAYTKLNENSLLIYPNTPAKQKEYQELVVRSFQVTHTDVKQMVAMVRGLVKAKDIYVNEQLNIFIIRDTLDAIRVVEKLVGLNDLPEPEVMLEVAVLEVQRNNEFFLGPKLPQQATYSFVPGAGAANVTLDAIQQAGWPGLKNFVVSNQVVIDFAQNLSNIDLLANPRIRVKNREKAKIHIGTREPIFTANVQAGVASVVTSTPTYIDIGIKVDVETIIGLNNDVTMKVALEVSNNLGEVKGPGGATAIRIGTRTAESSLTLKDGETQVMGGLMEESETKTVGGLAGLINIPGLDRLTSSQSIRRKKNEIVLLITPRIIRNITQLTKLESEFHFGTANEAGKLPVTIRKTGAQSLGIAPAGSGRGALPRNASQPFSLSNEATPNPFTSTASTAPALTMQAPANVGLDKEFSVNVRMVGAKASATAELILNYEASVLEALDSGDKSGTRTIKLGKDQVSGMAAQFRFKVITANPGTTEISVQNVTAEDNENGESIEVTLPPPASISIK